MESQYDGGEHSDALCVLPCRSPLTLDLMQQLSACGRFGRSLAKEDQTFIVISGTDSARRMGTGCLLMAGYPGGPCTPIVRQWRAHP